MSVSVSVTTFNTQSTCAVRFSCAMLCSVATVTDVNRVTNNDRYCTTRSQQLHCIALLRKIKKMYIGS